MGGKHSLIVLYRYLRRRRLLNKELGQENIPFFSVWTRTSMTSCTGSYILLCTFFTRRRTTFSLISTETEICPEQLPVLSALHGREF